MIYGYMRVSTMEQNEDRQFIALKEVGIENKNMYIDKMSGSNFARPQYRKLLKRLNNGDVLYITSIDRLGRNYTEIQEEWRKLTKERGVDIVVIDMPLLDTRKNKDLLGTFIADVVLQVLSFVAENERDNIRKRQAEGIAAAHRRGVQFGRPRREVPSNFMAMYHAWRAKELTLNEAANACGLPKGTFYAWARKMEDADDK